MGHIAKYCRDARRTEYYKNDVAHVGGLADSLSPYVCPAIANGYHTHALRDTGATKCVLLAKLVRPNTKRQCKVQDFGGQIKSYPTAIVHINSPYFNNKVEAIVVENGPYKVVIGNVPNIECPKQENYDDVGSNKNKEEFFVHQTASVKSSPINYPTRVREGGKTEFDVVEEEKRKEIANVTGPGGSNVQGSRDSADRSSSRTSGWYLWYRENGNGGRQQYVEGQGEFQPQRYQGYQGRRPFYRRNFGSPPVNR
uniref:Uncharacterized protein n=1 Tax=Biomphalaria glabrata TaxID=6526 RepID=A0A2C9K1X3_BIOGL